MYGTKRDMHYLEHGKVFEKEFVENFHFLYCIQNYSESEKMQITIYHHHVLSLSLLYSTAAMVTVHVVHVYLLFNAQFSHKQ